MSSLGISENIQIYEQSQMISKKLISLFKELHIY